MDWYKGIQRCFENIGTNLTSTDAIEDLAKNKKVKTFYWTKVS